jgi:hypothetical protein
MALFARSQSEPPLLDAEPETPLLDGFTDELARVLDGIELATWARIAAWAEESELALEDVRVLLVLAAHDRAFATAIEVAQLSGLSVDAVEASLRRLTARGLGEAGDVGRYALTEDGELAVAAVEGARRVGIRAYLRTVPRDERRLLEASLWSR